MRNETPTGIRDYVGPLAIVRNVNKLSDLIE